MDLVISNDVIKQPHELENLASILTYKHFVLWRLDEFIKNKKPMDETITNQLHVYQYVAYKHQWCRHLIA